MSTAGRLSQTVLHFSHGNTFHHCRHWCGYLCCSACWGVLNCENNTHTHTHTKKKQNKTNNKKKQSPFQLQLKGQQGLWWHISEKCNLRSNMDSFGIRSKVLFTTLGLFLSWFFHSFFFLVWSLWCLQVGASEPHQAGISKLLSCLFRKRETKDKGILVATRPRCSPFEVS